MIVTVHETFDPDGNLVASQIADLDAATITTIELGVTVESRPLTADEIVRYTPPTPVITAKEKLAQARTVLDQIASLPAPVLTADVVDLLDDLRTVL